MKSFVVYSYIIIINSKTYWLKKNLLVEISAFGVNRDFNPEPTAEGNVVQVS